MELLLSTIEEFFAVHLGFCHLYLFTCILCVVMDGSCFEYLKTERLFEISYCSGWCMNECETFVSIHYVKSDTYKVACQRTAA